MAAHVSSRRRFLVGAAATSLTALAACIPTPTPTAEPKPAAAQPTAAGAPQPTAAAAGAQQSTTAPKPAAPAGSAAPVDLLLWTTTYPPLVPYVERKVAEYKQKAPNVNLTYAPQGFDEKKIVTVLASGAGAPDAFNMGDWNLAMLRERNMLAVHPPEAFGKSKSEELRDVFYDYALTGLQDQRGLYGVPLEWNALSLYVFKKHFERVGLDPAKPPQDWQTLTDVALKTTVRDANGNIKTPGWQQHYGPGIEWPLKRLHALIVQLGGDVLNAEGTQAQLTTPEAQEAVQLYTDWTVKHKVSLKGFEVPGVQRPHASGDLPMAPNGPYQPQLIKTQNPSLEFGRDWDVANFPQWPGAKNKRVASPLWRWALFIPSVSKNPLEMSKFLYHVVSDTRGIHTEVGYVPSIKGWEDQAYVKEMPWIPTQMKDLAVGLPVPSTPKYPEMAQQVLEMLERIESGQQSVQVSTAEANQKINALLKA